MPDLHDLLTAAVPAVTPAFDEDDVRARVAVADRRRRRKAVGSMVAVVAAVALLISPALRQDEPAAVLTGPPGPTLLVPLSDWPSSIDFAGVEIELRVVDEPDEAMQSRVAMGSGEAALNEVPSDAVEPGNTTFQRAQNRVWFGCGTDQMVWLTEIGRSAALPPFEVPSGPARWLPAGALIEAGAQLAASLGCQPVAPEGTPATLRVGQAWLGPLAAAIDRAGLATCCAAVGTEESTWTLMHDGEVVSLTIAEADTVLWSNDSPAALARFGGGAAAVRSIPYSPPDLQMWFLCHGASVLTHPRSNEVVAVGDVVQELGCTPGVHPAFQRTLALSQVLRDVGAEVARSYPDPDVGRVAASLPPSSQLDLTSGVSSHVLASLRTPFERPVQALDPDLDGFGAVATCGPITHVIRANDDAGAAAALDLAERILGHPDCVLLAAAPRASAASTPSTAGTALPSATTDQAQPLESFVPEEQVGILTRAFALRLESAGFTVGEEGDSNLWVTVPSAPEVELAVLVAVADQIEPPVIDGADVLKMGGGEVVVDPSAPNVIFTCDEALVILGTERTDDGAVPQQFLAAAAQVVDALRCTPRSPLVSSAPEEGALATAHAVASVLTTVGLAVDPTEGDEEAATFGFQPSGPGTTRHDIRIGGSGAGIGPDAELIGLGTPGEEPDEGRTVAHLGGGTVAFMCVGQLWTVTADSGTVETTALNELTARGAGCIPSPP